MERINTFNETRRFECTGSALLIAVFFTVVKIWDQPVGHLSLEDSVVYVQGGALYSLDKVGSLVICRMAHKPGVDHVKRIKLGTD